MNGDGELNQNVKYATLVDHGPQAPTPLPEFNRPYDLAGFQVNK